QVRCRLRHGARRRHRARYSGASGAAAPVEDAFPPGQRQGQVARFGAALLAYVDGLCPEERRWARRGRIDCPVRRRSAVARGISKRNPDCRECVMNELRFESAAALLDHYAQISAKFYPSRAPRQMIKPAAPKAIAKTTEQPVEPKSLL